MKRIVVLWALLTLLPALGRAAIRIQSVEWQINRSGAKPRKGYEALASLKRGPEDRSSGRARALVTVDNSSGAAAGVTLRYAVYPKLAPVKGGDEARWVLPFRLEERRIPLVRAGAVQKVPIDTIQLDAYLDALKASGYWPTALRIEVMIEPKPGLPLEKSLAQAELPIEWK